jgi:hypothetical protein
MRWPIAPTDEFVGVWISSLGLPHDSDWPGAAIEAMAGGDLIKFKTQGRDARNGERPEAQRLLQ